MCSISMLGTFGAAFAAHLGTESTSFFGMVAPAFGKRAAYLMIPFLGLMSLGIAIAGGMISFSIVEKVTFFKENLNREKQFPSAMNFLFMISFATLLVPFDLGMVPVTLFEPVSVFLYIATFGLLFSMLVFSLVNIKKYKRKNKAKDAVLEISRGNAGEYTVTDTGKFVYFRLIGSFVFAFSYMTIVCLAYLPEATWIILLAFGVGAAIQVPFILIRHKSNTKPRIFTISDDKIMFSDLKKGEREIQWSAFTKLLVKVKGITNIMSGGVIFGSPQFMSQKPLWRQIVLKLFTGEEKKPVKVVKLMLFNDPKVKQILLLLQKFAEEKGKEIKIKKGARKYYSLQA